MQFPDRTGQASQTDHVQAKATDQQHERDELQPVNLRDASGCSQANEEREEEMPWDKRSLHKRDDGKQEADQQPEMLVQPPETERNPAGRDDLLSTFHTGEVVLPPRISPC